MNSRDGVAGPPAQDIGIHAAIHSPAPREFRTHQGLAPAPRPVPCLLTSRDKQRRVDIRDQLMVRGNDLLLDIERAGDPDRAGLNAVGVRIGVDEGLIERIVLRVLGHKVIATVIGDDNIVV